MAENKILVQIIDHENGDSVLGQDYFESREKAGEFKRISDRAYGKLLGEGSYSNRALPLSTSSRAPSILYSIQSESELKKPRLISDSTHPGGFSI